MDEQRFQMDVTAGMSINGLAKKYEIDWTKAKKLAESFGYVKP